MDVKTCDGDNAREPIVHVKDYSAGSDRSRLWITIDLHIHERSAFGIQGYRRHFERGAHDRAKNQSARLKLAAHEAVGLSRGVNVHVIVFGGGKQAGHKPDPIRVGVRVINDARNLAGPRTGIHRVGGGNAGVNHDRPVLSGGRVVDVQPGKRNR